MVRKPTPSMSPEVPHGNTRGLRLGRLLAVWGCGTMTSFVDVGAHSAPEQGRPVPPIFSQKGPGLLHPTRPDLCSSLPLTTHIHECVPSFSVGRSTPFKIPMWGTCVLAPQEACCGCNLAHQAWCAWLVTPTGTHWPPYTCRQVKRTCTVYIWRNKRAYGPAIMAKSLGSNLKNLLPPLHMHA